MNRDQALRRIQVKQQIRLCDQCELGKTANRVPFSGPTPARYVVLGEAPGRTEDRRLEPFVGLAGRLMRRMMIEAGLDPFQAMFCNTVCCNPWTRAPQRAEMDACRPNLLAQLIAADTPLLIAAGATALSSLVPDGHLRRLHGAVLTVDRRLVLPVYHPSFVLREPSNRPIVVKALEQMTALLAGLSADFFRGEWCVMCEKRADTWDERQVPYCWSHRKEPAKRVTADRRRRKKENKAAQGRLEL